jgi:hypothetical protein
VGGNLSLDVTLAVSFINNLNPASGNSFDILDWGSLAGTFTTLQLASLAGGLNWNTSQLYSTGVLTVGGVLGDYNHNGIVDAADYTVWRDTLGQTGLKLEADGDGDGIVDAADYDIWRKYFGDTGSPLLAPSSSIPEPSSLALSILAGFVLIARPRASQQLRS